MKINYGISISSNTNISALPELPEFTHLEIPGSMLADKNFTLPSRIKNKKIIIRNDDERRFFRTVSDAGSGIRQDFYRLVRQKTALAANIGAVGITVVPDLENLITADELPENFRSVLRVYCGIAEQNHLPLLLETRIPGKAAQLPECYIRFKHALLYPLRTLCEIHPHEPGALDAAENFAAGCKFDCDIFRICFDAAAGNHLTGTLFARIMKLLRQAGSDIPLIMFSPGNETDPGVCRDLVRLISTETTR